MIKATIGVPKPTNEKPYPKLMKSIFDQMIVLMVADGKGTVIIPIGTYQVGHFSNNWSMDSFKDYNETITLQNT